MPYAYLCDFDGTVSRDDIGAAFVARFSSLPGVEARSLLRRWREGEIGSREVIAAECASLSVTAEEALAFTRAFPLDPDFGRFAHEAQERGDHVMVVSEGLDFYVRDRLEQAGLGGIPCAAVPSRFEDGRVVAEFPLAGAGCGRCGNCKGYHVRGHQAAGYEVVLVGDGLSDRCGARAADHVLARGELIEWCRGEGIPAAPFTSFDDVAAFARRVSAVGEREAGPRRGRPARGSQGCVSGP